MRLFFIDCETYSDLDLPRVGARIYSAHDSTEVLCWSFYHEAWDEPVVIEGVPDLEICMDMIFKAMGEKAHSEHNILAHWGPFDRFIAEDHSEEENAFDRNPTIRDDMPQAFQYGPFYSMIDLAQLSLQVGGPSKLAHAARWVGSRKLEGARAIRTFSMPSEDGVRTHAADKPELWASFMEYAKQDAGVLSDIYDHLGNIPNPASHAEHYHVIERMNERGLPIDVPSVERTREVLEAVEPGLVAEFREITGFNPTQVKKLKEWLDLPDTKRETLETYVAEYELEPEVLRAIEIRMEVASATRHKLTPMLAQLDWDHRVRDQFVYHGAWTRRLTAWGTQPQNFRRGSPEESFFQKRIWEENLPASFFSEVKQNIRGYIKAPEGKLFVAADFSQIELRVMAWLAGEGWLLDALTRGLDPYKKLAADIFRCTTDDVTDDMRHVAKTIMLAAIFGISGEGYYEREGRRIGLTKSACYDGVEIFRAEHPAIVGFWETMQDMMEEVIRRPAGEGFVLADHQGVCLERYDDDIVMIVRPSGQYQCYWDPKRKRGKFDNTEIAFTKRIGGPAGQMVDGRTWGSRLAQGVVQGIAADLLLCGMRTAEEMGYPPIMSVHDEIVTEIDDDGDDGHVANLERIFASQLPAWAEGLPVKAEGWQGKRFRK